MRAFVLALATAGSLVLANAAMAQSTVQQGSPVNPSNQTGTNTAPPAVKQGGEGQQGGESQGAGASALERLSSQEAQEVAQQPEIQQVLERYPDAVKRAIQQASKSGQLIGVAQESFHDVTFYRAEVDRNGILYSMKLDADGKVLSFMPKTRGW